MGAVLLIPPCRRLAPAPLEERRTAVDVLLASVSALKDMLTAKGLPVPRVVFGGTPTFPVYAELPWPEAECQQLAV